jgi:hypothetical protein
MGAVHIEMWFSTMGICISDLSGEYITTVTEENHLYPILAKTINERLGNEI